MRHLPYKHLLSATILSAACCLTAILPTTAHAEQANPASQGVDPWQRGWQGATGLGSDTDILSSDLLPKEFAAKWLSLGPFELLPSLSYTQIYDDNVLRENSNEQDDLISQVSGRVALVSDLPRHQFNAGVAGVVSRNFDITRNNFEDFEVESAARLDIRRNLNLAISGEYGNYTENREDPNRAANALDLTEFNRGELRADLKYKPSRISVDVFSQFRQYDFDDVGLEGGGVENNDDRDRTTYEIGTRIGYDVRDQILTAYVKAAYGERDYDDLQDDNGFNRDGDYVFTAVGVTGRFTEKLSAELEAGYIEEYLDDAQLENTDDIVASANIVWLFSPFVTVTAGAVHRTIQATQVDVSNLQEQSYNLGLRYEFRDYLILGTGASLLTRDFEGSSRSDDEYDLGVNASYLLSRGLRFGAGYNFERRDSTQDANDYDRNRISLSVTSQF